MMRGSRQNSRVVIEIDGSPLMLPQIIFHLFESHDIRSFALQLSKTNFQHIVALIESQLTI